MTTSRALIADSRRASRSDATRTTCSHFAPITSRNRTKQEQVRRINRKRGTACCRTLFPQDQRVTGHGRVVLITQRRWVKSSPRNQPAACSLLVHRQEAVVLYATAYLE